MDRTLKTRLEAKLGGRLAGPIRQRHDQTEIRIAAGPRITTNSDGMMHRTSGIISFTGIFAARSSAR